MGKTYSKKERKKQKKQNHKKAKVIVNHVEIDVNNYIDLPRRVQGKTEIAKKEKALYQKVFKVSVETVNKIEALWLFFEHPEKKISHAWQPIHWDALCEIIKERDILLQGGILNDNTSGYLQHIFLMGYSIEKYDTRIDNEDFILEVLRRPDGKLDFNFFCLKTKDGNKVEKLNFTAPKHIWWSDIYLTHKCVNGIWLCGYSTTPSYTPNVMLKKLRIAEKRYTKKGE